MSILDALKKLVVKRGGTPKGSNIAEVIDDLAETSSGGGSGLPDVTAADNGKVLGVENGAWGKMDAPSGLPDVTQNDNEKILIVENGEWIVSTASEELETSNNKPIAGRVIADRLYMMQGNIDACFPIMFACDSTAKSALEQMSSSTVRLVTPVDIGTVAELFNYASTGYAIWMNGTKLDFGKMLVEIDLTNNAITLYARGKSSMVSGVMGVDTSWTVTSL